MPKKVRGRRRSSETPEEQSTVSQPCCILGCERYGTRLLTSLRASYQLKDGHSGRVCEGHYRRDLRRFKKNSEPTVNIKPKRKSSLSSSDQDEGGEEEIGYSSSFTRYTPYPAANHPVVTSESTRYYPQHEHHLRSFASPFPVIPTPSTPTSVDQKEAAEECMDYGKEMSIDPRGVNKFKIFCEFILKSESVI